MTSPPPNPHAHDPSWLESQEFRLNPTLLTALLQASVPVLKFTGFEVLEVFPGYARTRLPISFESSNQHGVHQAAIIGLCADYVGGIALGSVIHTVPVLGVHPQQDEHGASLWSISLKVNYQAPSSGDLIAIAQIEPAQQERIRRRFNSGSSVLEKVAISLWNGDLEVATAELLYFMRRSSNLRPASTSSSPHPLFTHKLKSSARLIAALRALEHEAPSRRLHDPYARQAAGPHGHLLAERFLIDSPQLQAMVAARTQHADALLHSIEGLKQVVMLGAGLDLRPFRLKGSAEVQVFELDFPEMLLERERVVADLGLASSWTRHRVGLDFELEDVAQALLDSGFDPLQPTLFINEGTSMYLSEASNARTLASVASLMQHPQSRLWIDHVQSGMFSRRREWPAVDRFLDSIERMGEPFIFGVPDAGSWLEGFGLKVTHDQDTGQVFPDLPEDAVYPLYRFVIAQREAETVEPSLLA